MINSERIIVAMDVADEERYLKLLNDLKGHKVWVKIGMELYYTLGPRAIELAKEREFKIFLDLKLHDIPNTVAQSLKSLCRHPIDMINLHAAGGLEMMKKASEAVRSSSHSPLLIAVTQLTSTTQDQMNTEQRIQGDLLESVTHFAKLAQEAGCQGVVSSPHEAQAIKLICGSRFLTVTPGIRPASSDVNDQKRFTTPLEASRSGVDFMVIGRPITQAQDPRAALESILKGDS
jgi:orotidine-5'-phosphate decarboxylase